MGLKALFKDLGMSIGRAIEPRSWREEREREEARIKQMEDEHNALMAKMKPNDGIKGFIYDTDKPAGVVIAVNIKKFTAHCIKRKSREQLDRRSIRSYGKATEANNGLHLMASIYVDEQNNIHLLEGNHRLEYLAYDEFILVNLFNHTGCSDAEFAKHVQLVMEKCGDEGLGVIAQGHAAFCNITFDSNGHYPVRYEERIFAPYFTIKAPQPKPIATAQLIEQPQHPAPKTADKAAISTVTLAIINPPTLD